MLGSEYGYYAVKPKSGLPLKLIVLDTTFRTGTAMGAINTRQYRDFLIPELEKSKQDKELVIIVSHHPASQLLTPATLAQELLARYGVNDTVTKLIRELTAQMRTTEDSVPRVDFKETLKSYPNVFLHINGHTHNNNVSQVGEAGHGYWEITTASLLGYPQQSRLFEIVNEGNGVGAIQTCVVDHNSAAGSLSDRSRKLAHDDQAARTIAPIDFPSNPTGNPEDRNTILRFPIPADIAKKL